MNFPAEREEKRQHRTWPGCRHSGDILTYLAEKLTGHNLKLHKTYGKSTDVTVQGWRLL